MKKFFSLFCALAIVLSVSAAPARKAHAMKFAMEQTKEVKAQKSLQAEKAVTVAPVAAKKAPAKAVKPHVAAQPKVLAVEKTAFKARKAATDVTIGSWYVEDWGEDGEFYLYAEDNTFVFYFDLYYGEGAEDLIPGKEYTVDDVYVSESTGEQYAGVFHDGEWYYGIKTLSLTKTVDEKNLVHFVGSVLDSLDGEWTFHYDEKEFVPTGEVVEHEFKNTATISYLSYYGQWSIKASDSKYAFRMDINEKVEGSESPVGEYNSADSDFDIDYTWFEVFNEAGDSSWMYKAVEAAAVISESSDSILIAIDFLCENGVRYKATAFVADPTAQEEADFVATDLEVDASYFDWFGVVWLDASNADASLSLTIYPESGEDLSGEYVIGSDESANASGSIKTAEGTFDLFSGTFTVAKGDAGYVVTGKVLAANNVEYNLNLSYVKPEPTRQAELSVEGLELSFDFEAETPWWQLYGYNADSTVMVTVSPIIATQFAGTYKGEDLDPDYTYIITDITYDEEGDLDTYNYFKLVDADLNVTYNEADSTMVITGTYVGRNLNNRTDIPEISVTFSGKIPTPDKSDMTFEFADSEEGITVTPSNDEDAWDWYVVNAAMMEEYGAEYIAKTIYSNYGDYYAVKGEQLLSFEEDLSYYLKSSGTYYLIVWGAGENNVSTEAFVHEFEFEAQMSDLTFEFADGEDGITVTPSNNEDAWDWYIADAATIEEFGSAQALAEAVYNYYGNQYAVTGEQLISWNDVALYTDGAAGTFYLIVWGAGPSSLTTEASVHQFEAEEQEGSPYDSPEAFEVEFADYEVDTQYAAQYHVILVSAEDEDGNYVSIEFNVAADATELAAGTFQIAETGAAGTVTTGSVDQYIYGSFAGHLTPSGQISIPFWLFAEGTVTIAEDGKITVDALNTKGAAITVVLNKLQDAVDNTTVESTAAKFIENGQLFIEKSGKRYNVLGSQVR